MCPGTVIGPVVPAHGGAPTPHWVQLQASTQLGFLSGRNVSPEQQRLWDDPVRTVWWHHPTSPAHPSLPLKRQWLLMQSTGQWTLWQQNLSPIQVQLLLHSGTKGDCPTQMIKTRLTWLCNVTLLTPWQRLACRQITQVLHLLELSGHTEGATPPPLPTTFNHNLAWTCRSKRTYFKTRSVLTEGQFSPFPNPSSTQ